MKPHTNRGARRLLMTAGAMTLGLSAIAPGVVAADTGDEDQVEKKVWVCHQTASETNPWVLIHVSVNAVGHEGHEDDVWLRTPEQLEALLAALEVDDLHPSVVNHLDAETISHACAAVAADETVTVVDEGTNTGGGQGGDGTGNGGGQNNDGTGNGGGQNDEGTNTGGGQGGDGTDNGTAVGGDDAAAPATPADPGVPGEPATPAEPNRPPLPVLISTDAVEAPRGVVVAPAEVEAPRGVVVAPAEVEAPVAVDVEENEVLGVTTTRTPTGGGSEVTAGAVTGSLPRTGADGTRGLVAAGGALLLAGLALEATSRRRKDALTGGQLSAS